MATAVVFDQDSYSQGAFEPEYGIPRMRGVSPGMRAFPNEDVYFWRKSIDNSRLARQADPRIWETCWRFFSAMTLVVVVAVGLLLPNAANLLSGIQLQRLRAENSQLKDEKRRLAIEENRLLGPERMESMADKLQMKNAGPRNSVHLRTGDSQAVALNRAKVKFAR